MKTRRKRLAFFLETSVLVTGMLLLFNRHAGAVPMWSRRCGAPCAYCNLLWAF